MKIALISTYPPRKCGIGIYTSLMADGFAYNKYHVQIISFKGFNYEDKRVVPLLQKGNPFSYINVLFYLKRKKYDRVLIHHEYVFYNLFYFPIFLFLLKIFGIKTNMIMHSVGYNEAFLKKALFLLYHEVLLLGVDNLFLHNESAKIKLNENILFKKNAHIVPLPIPFKKGIPSIPGKKPLYNILCFGFIDYMKGFDIACKAVGGLKDFRLRIVGSVSIYAEKRGAKCLSNLKKIVNKYPNVELKLGFVSDDKKEEYFRKSDFVILPYRVIEQSAVLSDLWGFYKIPICSDLRSLKDETSNGKFGVLFKKEDSLDLRKKLKYISKDTRRQEEILNNIKKLVLERNYNSITKKYINLMK